MTSNHLIRLLSALALAWAGNAWAASLPGALSPTEVEGTVRVLGFGSTARLMRSAEPYVAWPGIKIGFEAPLADPGALRKYGDGGGSVPGTHIVPRLYVAKGLSSSLELIASILPTGSPTGVGTYGGFLKYSFAVERNRWGSGAFYAGYTHIDAYQGDFEGDNLEAGMVISKDYVRFKPFVGAGVLVAKGGVRPGLASGKRTATQLASHLKLGFELELPVNLTVQCDLFNDRLMGSLFMGMHF